MSITRLVRQRGISLIELIIFIVVIGVAVVGVLLAFSMSTRASADPMIQKQALAIAEALLEEIQLQPFTYCDPDDPVAATALVVGDCATPEVIGVEGGESRTAIPLFDNVSDYNGVTLNPVTDINGTALGLDAYIATIAVATQGIGAIGIIPAISAAEALLITVTVTGPGSTTVVLHGYRVRYAPNALP